MKRSQILKATVSAIGLAALTALAGPVSPASAATAYCTLTVSIGSNAATAINSGGQYGTCYRVQSRGRAYYGGGVYSTITGPISSSSSSVTNSTGLDRGQGRGRPISSSTNWSGYTTAGVGDVYNVSATV